MQAFAPKITGKAVGKLPTSSMLSTWGIILTGVTLALVAVFYYIEQPENLLIIGLLLFGFVFAVNSSLHSYVIVAIAKEDGASMDIGFYYMANAMGRLLGTLLSGWLFQLYGFIICLIISAVLLAVSAILVRKVHIPVLLDQR